jgi:hypothetical protein
MYALDGLLKKLKLHPESGVLHWVAGEERTVCRRSRQGLTGRNGPCVDVQGMRLPDGTERFDVQGHWVTGFVSGTRRSQTIEPRRRRRSTTSDDSRKRTEASQRSVSTTLGLGQQARTGSVG